MRRWIWIKFGILILVLLASLFPVSHEESGASLGWMNLLMILVLTPLGMLFVIV